MAPLFSAKSVDGVRAYELARRQYKEKGKAKTDVLEDFDHSAAEALNIQRINIRELELLDFRPGDAGAPPDPVRVHSRFAAAEYGPGSRINVTDTSGLNLPIATIRIACGKGTYIRAFARDLGEALGSGAHLNSLRRTKSGGFAAETALSVSQALELLTDKQ
ncbi:MAG: hypothetical protein IJK05_05470 [Bacteroidales bacterium]|nr:hypothetical protein [Bacteroidales bacterium]